MISLTRSLTLATSLVITSAGCGDDAGVASDAAIPTPDAKAALFPDNPECVGDPIVPGMGNHAMVMSSLKIGKSTEGIDLDGDGEIDNVFSAVGTLAGDNLDKQFDTYDLIAPLEFFGLDGAQEDQCVKFSIYTGDYKVDGDNDGAKTSELGGDCNDTTDAIGPDVVEILGNGIDDDCDGLADENGDVASEDTSDSDLDGVTIADGDCDDTDGTVAAGMPEICGDGKDNDCDGVADFGINELGVAQCNPYDSTPDKVVTDPSSFDATGAPNIIFDDGVLTSEAGKLVLRAGPSVFSLFFAVNDETTLELRITGAQIVADVVDTAAGAALENGLLTGVLDVESLEKIRGLDVEAIMLIPEDSFLDAIFANFLGTIMPLPRIEEGEYKGCQSPDIDVDQDGLEAFCDSDPEDANKTVDVCIDGDGTIIKDTPTTECSDALDDNGKRRFNDGISITLTFDAVPTNL